MAKRSKTREAKSGSTRPADDWLWAALLFGAVAIAYIPVWWAGYVWDDNQVVTENPAIVSPDGLKQIWTGLAADICPLTLTTFWVEFRLWGTTALPYHLVNVVLHGACAILLWRVLRMLRVPGAWLGAALWALHPVMVESVAWVSELKNTESGVFFLLSVLFFIRGLEMNAPGKSMGRSYGLTLLFAALAIASKSSTVILPAVLCLVAWWMEGRWSWRRVVGVLPIVAMAVLAGAVSILTQHGKGADSAEWARSWPERVAIAGDAIWFYLGKLIWPYPLEITYPRWQIDAGSVVSYLPLAALAAVMAVLWVKRNLWGRPLFFAMAYFVVALLPVAGLLNMTFFQYAYVADHFQYLAAMGPLALVGAGMARISQVAFFRPMAARAMGTSLILLMLAALTWWKACAYENEETLWDDTLASNPGAWAAYNNIGMIREREGKNDEALPMFRKSLETNPRYTSAMLNLGGALLIIGDVQGAIEQCRNALAIEPDNVSGYANLGMALVQAGRGDEAVAALKRALELDPDDTPALTTLGMFYVRQNRPRDALPELQRLVELRPDDPKARNDYGGVLYELGELDPAQAQFEEALRLNPNFVDARNNLAIVNAAKAKQSATGH